MAQTNVAAAARAATIKQPERPKLLQIMGPGLITGASDDDPRGIATYSQAGAKKSLKLMGWLTTTVMAAAAIGMFVT